MRQMQNVLWRKGVLLTPQHLQAQDRFLQDQLEFHLSSLTSYPWGFRALEVDREALDGGILQLGKARGIFPDGLLFDSPSADELPPPRPVAEGWPEDLDALTVHLAVPERRIDGQNVGSGTNQAYRYHARVINRRDENTGLVETAIEVAGKNLRLLTDLDALEGFSLLPVARLLRARSGELTLDPAFVPPVLDLRASERLLSLARRLIELLSAKSTALAGARRERPGGLADFGASDVANFWLLYTVNAHLPGIRHLYESEGVHPLELYRWLVGLSAALATFSATERVQDLPSYQHGSLGAVIGQLDETARLLLETVVPSRTVTIQLTVTKPSVHAAAIEEDRLFGAEQVFLGVAADVKAAEVESRAQTLLKITSAERLEHLITQALPGLPFTLRPTPPGALPVKLDYTYFELQTSGPDWEAVRLARNLAAHVPGDLPGARLELIFLLPKKR